MEEEDVEEVHVPIGPPIGSVWNYRSGNRVFTVIDNGDKPIDNFTRVRDEDGSIWWVIGRTFDPKGSYRRIS